MAEQTNPIKIPETSESLTALKESEDNKEESKLSLPKEKDADNDQNEEKRNVEFQATSVKQMLKLDPPSPPNTSKPLDPYLSKTRLPKTLKQMMKQIKSEDNNYEDPTLKSPSKPVIKVTEGRLRGIEKRSVNSSKYFLFLGIPYAKPPIKELRFCDPLPPRKWKGIKNVMNQCEKICMQYHQGPNVLVGGEDCLYLNVFTPLIPPGCNNLCKNICSQLLPVMFYIHGGGFMTGSGIKTSIYGPDFIVQKNVVLVTFNYRLNVLGFLCLDRTDAPGNMGLKDQVMALKWVNRNIQKFGGDPNNVTIFGNDAGAASVNYHIISPMSKGLFHKAIAQSGSPLNHWAFSQDMKSLAFKIPMHYGQEINDCDELYNYLKCLAPEDLVRGATLINSLDDHKGGLYYGFVPTLEKPGAWKPFLKQLPYDILKSGTFTKVPYMSGYCNNESVIMTAPDKINKVYGIATERTFGKFLPFELNDRQIDVFNYKLKEIYLKENIDKNSLEPAVNFLSDVDFISGIIVNTTMIASGSSKSIYLYEFAHSGNLNYSKNVLNIVGPGSFHDDDIGYIFNVENVSEKARSRDHAVRNRVIEMWTSFAKYGDPTPKLDTIITTKWDQASDPNSLKYLKIGEFFKMIENPYPERMEVYRELYRLCRVAKSVF